MYERTLALIGEDNLNKIKRKNILVLGTGGVGGYTIETLVRSGIQNITIVDYDKIDSSNINRQVIANSNNIGNYKVNEWEKRIKEINKDIKVKKINEKITKDNINILFEDNYDYIIDACDTVIVKKILIKLCKEKTINLLTVCGMGKKLDITKIKICDIKDTSYDPIAKSLRKYIKDEKIRGKVMCVFSSEKPNNTNKEVIASMMPVPSVAGIYAANYILQDIIKK